MERQRVTEVLGVAAEDQRAAAAKLLKAVSGSC